MTDQGAGYSNIIAHYEDCLDRHGDSHLGVDWPNEQDADTRYSVMLDMVGQRTSSATLLDFGCGAGHLLEYIRRNGWAAIDYRGLDASTKFVDLCRRKFPATTFHCRDVLQGTTGIDPSDYVVMNGVLTERCGVSEATMLDYMEALLMAAWPLARKGMAFNVMSAHVDWKRDDLFHVPFDTMARLVRTRLSRHFRFRQDYGLYEFTTYVYREPCP